MAFTHRGPNSRRVKRRANSWFLIGGVQIHTPRLTNSSALFEVFTEFRNGSFTRCEASHHQVRAAFERSCMVKRLDWDRVKSEKKLRHRGYPLLAYTVRRFCT